MFFIVLIIIILGILAFILNFPNKINKDKIKLIATALIVLALIVAIPLSIFALTEKFMFPKEIVYTSVVLIFLIVSSIAAPLVWWRQRKLITEKLPAGTILPNNPLLDIIQLLSIIKPDERILSVKKAKKISIVEGGKFTSRYHARRYTPESFTKITIVETDKAYYIDRRKSVLNYVVFLFILSIALAFFIPDISIVLLIVSIGILIVLLVIPYQFIRFINKDWLTSENKIENELEINGIYPDYAFATLNPSAGSITNGFEFHYKYRFVT